MMGNDSGTDGDGEGGRELGDIEAPFYREARTLLGDLAPRYLGLSRFEYVDGKATLYLQNNFAVRMANNHCDSPDAAASEAAGRTIKLNYAVLESCNLGGSVYGTERTLAPDIDETPAAPRDLGPFSAVSAASRYPRFPYKLIKHDGNAMAIAALKKAIDEREACGGLITLIGESSAGKTALIGSEIRKLLDARVAAGYASVPEILSYFKSHNGQTDPALYTIGKARVVFLDEAQAVFNKDDKYLVGTGREVKRLLDAVPLVVATFTGDIGRWQSFLGKFPGKDDESGGYELGQRFAENGRCTVEQPEGEGRLAFLQEMAGHYGIDNPGLIEELHQAVPTGASPRVLKGHLKTIELNMRENNGQTVYPAISYIVYRPEGQMNLFGDAHTPRQMVVAAANRADVKLKDILDGVRTAAVSAARTLAVHMLRDADPKLPHVEIAKLVGMKNHTSVRPALQRWDRAASGGRSSALLKKLAVDFTLKSP